MNLGLRMDGRPHELEIPEHFLQLAHEISNKANEIDSTLPIAVLDILVINKYNPRSKLNFHEGKKSFALDK